MLEGVEKYAVSKSSEKELRHSIINVVIKKTMRCLEKKMPSLLEKVVSDIDKELQYWNRVIFEEKGIDLSTHLVGYTRLDLAKWHLKVQSFCRYLQIQKQDEYILNWEEKKLPSYIFQLHKIEYRRLYGIKSGKSSKLKQEIINIGSVQPDAKSIAMDITLFMYGFVVNNREMIFWDQFSAL